MDPRSAPPFAGPADAEAMLARRRAAQRDRTALAEDRWRRFREAAGRRRGVTERSRLEQRLDRILSNGRWPGRALQLARSGLWIGRLTRSLGYGDGPTAGLLRYARSGSNPLVRPKALFDQAWYLEKTPELRGGGWAPLAHYLRVGDAQGRSPHPLFDARDYRARHAVKIAASRQTALQHFLFVGAAEGYDPHPLFDLRFYVGRCEEVASTGENPLVHYLRQGWREGLDPHPLFAGDWYAARNPQAAASGSAPLLHYLLVGAAAGRDPHPLFDAAWYAARRRDVAGSGYDPLSHFLRVGARQRASPSPHFDLPYYLEQHAELAESGVNPLVHYVTEGAFGGAWPAADFDEAGYLAEHPEAADTPWSGLEHWLRTEGVRPQAPSGSPGRWVSAEALFEQLRANGRTRDPAAYNLPAYDALSAELRRPSEPPPIRSTPVGAALGRLQAIEEADPALADAAARAVEADLLLFAPGPVAGELAPLVEALAAPDVGVGAPCVVTPDGRLSSAGVRFGSDATLHPNLVPGRRRVDAPGPAAAVRRSEFLAVGGFDPAFTTLAAALADLSLRLRARGLATVCATDATLVSPQIPPETAADRQALLERWDEAIEHLAAVRVIAFLRPDLSPAGMSEPIARALPNYRGHHQPQLPATAYDPHDLDAQAALARRYGVTFCHPLRLEAPGPAHLLAADASDMPFCLCLAQGDATALADAAAPYLRHPGALRVHDAPLVLAAAPRDGPGWCARFRNALRAQGVTEAWLVRFTDFGLPAGGDPREEGFDSGVDFAWAADASAIAPPGPVVNRRFRGAVRDFRKLAALAMAADPAGRLPALVAGFDDTACSQDEASVFHHASPGAFQAWLEAAFAQARAERFGEEKLVFVHAWNAWAEGAHLEPDVRFGHGWLEAVRNAADADLLERP